VVEGVDDLIDSAHLRQKRQRYKGMWGTGTVIGQTIEGSITSAGVDCDALDHRSVESVDAILLYHMDHLM